MDDIIRQLAKLVNEPEPRHQAAGTGHSAVSEKHQHLLSMLTEAKEAKRRHAREHNATEGRRPERRDASAPAVGPSRRGHAQNFTSDVLPWCDEPKGGKSQQYQNKQRAHTGTQGWQNHDNSFLLVDPVDCGPSGQFPGGQFPNGQFPNGQFRTQRGGHQHRGSYQSRGQHQNRNQRGQEHKGPPPQGPPPDFRQGQPFHTNHSQKWRGASHHAAGGGHYQARGRGMFVPHNSNFQRGSVPNIAAQQDGTVTDVLVRLNTQKQTFTSNTDGMSQQFSPEEIIALKKALMNDQLAENKPQTKKKKKKKKAKAPVSKSVEESASGSDSASESGSESEEENSNEDSEPVKPVKKKPAAKNKKKRNKNSAAATASSSASASEGVPNDKTAGAGAAGAGAAGAGAGAGAGAAEPQPGAKAAADAFQLYIGANLDDSILKSLNMNQELKNMMLLAKDGESIIPFQPRTVGELVNFKKKYPNAEVIILE